MSDISSEAGYDPALTAGRSGQFVVLSGCSGGGKSSLIDELAGRGFAAYAEPGRQVVKEQLYIGGNALPWDDVGQFVELTMSRSIHLLVMAARTDRLAFFDRGLIDQISGAERAGLPVPQHLLTAADRFRYCETVFVVPPWPEIFSVDSERRHSFDDAVAAYDGLLEAYQRFGYRTVAVPKDDVGARADFILAQLGGQASSSGR